MEKRKDVLDDLLIDIDALLASDERWESEFVPRRVGNAIYLEAGGWPIRIHVSGVRSWADIPAQPGSNC